jgi:hypothetical protein
MDTDRADSPDGDVPVRHLPPGENTGGVTAGRIELVTCTCGCTFTRAEGHVCDGEPENRGGRDWPDPRKLAALIAGLIIGIGIVLVLWHVLGRHMDKGQSSSTHGQQADPKSFSNGNGPPPPVWGQETHWWQLI